MESILLIYFPFKTTTVFGSLHSFIIFSLTNSAAGYCILLQGVATKTSHCWSLCLSTATAGLALKYKIKIKLLPSPMIMPYSRLMKTQERSVMKNGMRSISGIYLSGLCHQIMCNKELNYFCFSIKFLWLYNRRGKTWHK